MKQIALENFLRLEGEECSTELLESHILAADVSALADVRSVDKAAVAAAAAAMLQSPPSYAVLGTTAGSPPYKLVTSWLK